MKLISASVFVGLPGTSVMGHASSFVIDDFSCSDSVSQTGVGATESFVSCPGSLGGFRGDTIVLPGGSADAVSTMNSNPPTGEITGTIGSGLSGGDVMTWFGSTKPGEWDLPDLDLVGDSILIPIESGSGGTLTVSLGSGSASVGNRSDYSATFLASSSLVDVLIPFRDPTVLRTGANLNDVTAIGLQVGVPVGGI
jgi:hypothetical protein